ncbi:hypothetical protein LguiA_026599 [Lonicera macranthoides]
MKDRRLKAEKLKKKVRRRSLENYIMYPYNSITLIITPKYPQEFIRYISQSIGKTRHARIKFLKPSNTQILLVQEFVSQLWNELPLSISRATTMTILVMDQYKTNALNRLENYIID